MGQIAWLTGVVGVLCVTGCTVPGEGDLRSTAQQVPVVTPLPADAKPWVGHRLYEASADLVVNGRPAVESFGVSHVVALPDGTVFAQQNALVEFGGDRQHEGDNHGLALIRMTADGVAAVVDNPYADRDRGLDVTPLCASAAGDLYAIADEPFSLVIRDRSGDWRPVTAGKPTNSGLVGSGDGGPADRAILGFVTDCAVAADGTVYLADGCTVRAIDPAGRIDTVAGRPEIGGDTASGCGQVDSDNRSDPPTVPLARYDGPAREAELGEVSALTATADSSLWLSGLRGLQRYTPDGHLRSFPIPAQLVGPYQIKDLASLPDGTLLAAFGILGPTGIASRDPDTGEWTILLTEANSYEGRPAPAPLDELSLYAADIATSRDRLYIGVLVGDNAGIVAVPVG